MNKEEQVMNGFRELYNKLVWLNKDKMEEGLKGFKSSEVHCIEYIENNTDSNVTQLAEAFYVTRGAISRMTKKLINKGLIESYQKSENKKKSILSLLNKGKKYIKFTKSCTMSFKSGIKLYLSK